MERFAVALFVGTTPTLISRRTRTIVTELLQHSVIEIPHHLWVDGLRQPFKNELINFQDRNRETSPNEIWLNFK